MANTLIPITLINKKERKKFGKFDNNKNWMTKIILLIQNISKKIFIGKEKKVIFALTVEEIGIVNFKFVLVIMKVIIIEIIKSKIIYFKFNLYFVFSKNW